MSARQVVVIGAGVIGVTTAHALLNEGYQVTLIEAEAAAAQGTSQANGGFVSAGFCAPWAMPGLPRQLVSTALSTDAPVRWRPDFSWSQLKWLRQLFAHCTAEHFSDHRARMVRLALLSRACLQQVMHETQMRFDFATSGALLLMRRKPPAPALAQRLQDLQCLGIHAQWCDSDPLHQLEPALRPTLPVAGGLYVKDDASGDCAQFVQALLERCIDRGMRFETRSPVDALDLDRRGRRLRAVRSGHKVWQADCFVFATGVHSARLLRSELKLPVVPVKGYSVTFDLPADQGPSRGVIDEASKLAVARLGQRVRLAGMAELVGHDLRVEERRCEQLISAYEALYGPVQRSVVKSWAGLRPTTPDGTPIIGATAIEGLYLNTGHGTYGWTLACGSAQVLADIVAGRPSAVDQSHYALERSAPSPKRSALKQPSLT